MKQTIYMLLTLAVFVIAACSGEGKSDEKKVQSNIQKSAYDVQVFEIEKGWGFTISKNGKALIKQKHIPCIQGIKPFATSDDAIRVGKLMILKLEAGNSFPSVTIQEMDSLKIDY